MGDIVVLPEDRRNLKWAIEKHADARRDTE
jgi:hypothetical protein